DGLLVGGVGRRQPGRAEHGDLAQVAVGGEDLEGVAQLLERGAEQLDVAAGGAVADQLVGRLADLLHQLLAADGGAVVGVGLVVEVWEGAGKGAGPSPGVWLLHGRSRLCPVYPPPGKGGRGHAAGPLSADGLAACNSILGRGGSGAKPRSARAPGIGSSRG